MRIVVKGADFSAVSIGKVVEDLSFEINKDNVADKMVNWNGTSASSVTYYQISDNQLSEITNANRVRTDYIKVTPGMKIKFNKATNTATIPFVVSFDENKNVLGVDKCFVSDAGTLYDTEFTIPSGVSYIWVQLQVSAFTQAEFLVKGIMPA